MKCRPVLFLVPIFVLGLSSCSIVKPDGGLKDLVEGDVRPVDSSVAKASPGERQVRPLESGAPVRWKIEF